MKKISFLSSILFVILLLSGCVNGEFHVTIHKDGSGDLNYRLAVDPSLLNAGQNGESTLDEMKKLAEKDGYVVSQFKEDGLYGIEASKHVENITEFSTGDFFSFFTPNMTANNTKNEITIDKGFFFQTYQMNTKVDLTTIGNDKDPLSRLFFDRVDLTFKLTLPFELTEHNASRVENKTYEWDLLLGETNNINATARFLNIKTIATSLIIFLTTLAVIFIVRKRKSST